MTEAPLTYRQVIALPDMRGLLAAMCLSRLAERMFALAIVLFVLQRFEAPSLAGWAAFLAMAPGLVSSPLAGAAIDRLGAARAVVVDMIASALLLLAMPFAAGSLAALLLLVALYSLTSPLSAAGVRSLLPLLVPRAALDRANALDTAQWAVIDVLGPALCGLLFAVAGGAPTLVVVAALNALAGALLLGRKRLPGPAAAPRHALLREALDGVLTVARDASLRGIAVAYSLYQASWGVLVVAVPVAATRALGAGGAADVMVGGLWGLAGAAAGLGALAAGRARTERREKWLIAGGMLATATALAPFAAGCGLVGLTLGLALIGLMAGVIDVGLLSLRQRRTDPDRLGRVLAVSMSLNMAGLPLGSALGGLIVAASPQAAFATAAMAAALGALAALLLISAHSRNGISAEVVRR